jgi:pimeloyl-ACP methyl ester carboxylesterase
MVVIEVFELGNLFRSAFVVVRGQIEVPTLIAAGERDFPDFHRIADILSKKIQNSQRVTLRGAGHISNMETPREFNEAVLSFLVNV